MSKFEVGIDGTINAHGSVTVEASSAEEAIAKVEAMLAGKEAVDIYWWDENGANVEPDSIIVGDAEEEYVPDEPVNDPKPAYGTQAWAETYSDDLGESNDY
jgi:hypothetical protein